MDVLKPVPGYALRVPHDPRPSKTYKRKPLIVDEQVSILELPSVEDRGSNLLGNTRIWIDAPQRPGGSDQDLRSVRMPSDGIKAAQPRAEVPDPRGTLCSFELNDEALSPEARPLLWKTGGHGSVGGQAL